MLALRVVIYFFSHQQQVPFQMGMEVEGGSQKHPDTGGNAASSLATTMESSGRKARRLRADAGSEASFSAYGDAAHPTLGKTPAPPPSPAKDGLGLECGSRAA